MQKKAGYRKKRTASPGASLDRLVSLLTFCMLGILAGGIVFLNGCSTVHRDGPPHYHVDVSRIPDAKPKAERLSKYGNQPYYRVRGRLYHVLASSEGYEARGTASWYGTKFDRHYTSNGERYNMLAMTAAHKTLPLPTYLEVTNLANGRKVIVRVNDRGPFVSNRLLDLSYVAARKLGMTGRGTAEVKIRAINPATEQPVRQDNFWIARNNTVLMHQEKKSVLSHHEQAGIYIQMGAFKNRIFAERMKNRLAKISRFPVRIVRHMDRLDLYRVEIGPVRDKVTAKTLRRKIGLAGLGQTHLVFHRQLEV